MRIVTTLFAICLVVVAAPAAAMSSTGYHGRREVIKAMQGVVATDDGRCSAIGRDMLQDGGNAIDATVAAALCLGVVSPASSGIGGGAFMLVRLANGNSQAYDFRETAPLHSSKVNTKISTCWSTRISWPCMTCNTIDRYVAKLI